MSAKETRKLAKQHIAMPPENQPWERGPVGPTQIPGPPDLENGCIKTPEPSANLCDSQTPLL